MSVGFSLFNISFSECVLCNDELNYRLFGLPITERTTPRVNTDSISVNFIFQPASQALSVIYYPVKYMEVYK